MSKFFKLVKNEFIKMFKKKSGFVPFALMLVVLVAIPIAFDIFSAEKEVADVEWKAQLTAENAQIEKDLGITKEEIAATKIDAPEMAFSPIATYQKNQYHLENDIATDTGALGYMVGSMVWAKQLVFLLVIIYASSIVAREYAFGTIKFLLIRSVSRSQVILSKLVSIILAAVMFYLFALVSLYFTGAYFEGFVPETYRTVEIIDGAIVESSLIGDIFRTIGFNIIELFTYVALAFFVSTAMKSVGAAIGISMFLNYVVSGLVAGLLAKKYEWSKYILFTNSDLGVVYAGTPPVAGMTVGFSITMLILYAVAFLAFALAIFTKRDV